MTEHIIYSKDGAVASIRLNRPEKKNAITVAMYGAMAEALHDAGASDDIRAVGIFGGDAFTAGNDIGDFVAAGGFDAGHPVVKFLYALRDFRKPLIAGVRGAAIGIGTTMLLHCDAVVAGTSARFSMPFTRLGLVPEGGASALLPLIAGRMRASWYLLSGEGFGAEQALDMGLATRVVQDADVDATVAVMCGELAQLPPNSIATTKQLLRAPVAELTKSAMEAEMLAFAKALQSEEVRAAFVKFLNR